MAGIIESEAVFTARCAALSMPAAMVIAITTAGYKSVGTFAYCCSFVPGAADDAPLVAVATTILGRLPDGPEMALVRRLFFECFTLVQADLKMKIEQCDDGPIRKLAVPERAHRYNLQSA